MRLQIGVFATIADGERRILLVHHTDWDWWCQPGGRLDRGETPWEGVIRGVREVREESALAQPGRLGCPAAPPVLRWLPSGPARH